MGNDNNQPYLKNANKTSTVGIVVFVSAILVIFIFLLKQGNQSRHQEQGLVPTTVEPNQPSNDKAKQEDIKPLIAALKNRITQKKFYWDLSVLSLSDWRIWGKSVNGLPLIYWTCGNPTASNRSLILSSVHGDEVTPAFFGFRMIEWLMIHSQLCQNRFIVIAPMVNPDGFLRYSNGTRTNYNKVDLNRNFETPDWDELALKLWKTNAKAALRRFPGHKAGSEPETQFQQWLIAQFKPTKIMSVHSPLNMLDYDGPESEAGKHFSDSYIKACEALKNEIASSNQLLHLEAYGFFPGSLGNYAGKQRGIPTITIELPSVDASKAAWYFGLMEESNRVFIEYEVGSPHHSPNPN